MTEAAQRSSKSFLPPAPNAGAGTLGTVALGLDALVGAYVAVAPSTPLEEAVGMLVNAVVATLGDVGVAACLGEQAGGRNVVCKSARQRESGAHDALRVLPEFAHEEVLAPRLPPGPGELTSLHLASDDADRFAAGTADRLLAERLVQLIGNLGVKHKLYLRAEVATALEAHVIRVDRLASLGQSAASVVHELNNPLTSIVAYSDYLHRKAKQSASDPSDVERLARINEAAERILRLARGLTEYARPTAPFPTPVSIHDILERALIFCEHDIATRGIQIERRFGDVAPVLGLAGPLTQVFVNLFTNASHAMPEEGARLTIATSMTDTDTVAIWVMDDGHGIPPEALPRIFEPFFTTKANGGGTGLGLSIVRNIVEGHGGTVHAGGNTPKGSVFRVELPASRS